MQVKSYSITQIEKKTPKPLYVVIEYFFSLNFRLSQRLRTNFNQRTYISDFRKIHTLFNLFVISESNELRITHSKFPFTEPQ